MSKFLIATIFILLAVGIGIFVIQKQVNPPVNGGVACTMEAKLCSDGSYVGRTGPKCEFSPCPTNN